MELAFVRQVTTEMRANVANNARTIALGTDSVTTESANAT